MCTVAHWVDSENEDADSFFIYLTVTGVIVYAFFLFMYRPLQCNLQNYCFNNNLPEFCMQLI